MNPAIARKNDNNALPLKRESVDRWISLERECDGCDHSKLKDSPIIERDYI